MDIFTGIYDGMVGIHDFFYGKMGVAFYYALIFLAVIAALAQWRLYEKAGQPGIAALVPVWNVIIFLRIVGRPASDIWKMLIPIYGQFYFIPKVWIEICKSFGKHSTLDHVLVIVFNGLYILNMGLSYETRYQGPVHGKQAPPPPRKLTSQPSLA
jgi:signal peptidase I